MAERGESLVRHAPLHLPHHVEIRAGDTWRNVRATLESIKVVEYERAGARVWQTTDVRPEAAALLRKLKVPLPPKLHAVVAIPAAEQPQA